jgi:undecaprenyl-diphosphatase
MNSWQAMILGIIQGLTEFLPISSTAHLRIVPALLGWDDPGAAFTAVIQWGTLVAVLIYFRTDIARISAAMLEGIRRGRPFDLPDARMGWMIGAGTVPIVVLGVLFKKYIDTTLRSLYVISASLLALALLLSLAEWLVKRREAARLQQKDLGKLGWLDAVLVGLAQAVALIPGSSRSGVTITAGLFLKMTRETAARFSFLLSLPAVFGAGLYELYKERHELLASQADVVNLVIATVVAGFVGYAAIAFLLAYLKTHTTAPFIAYRIGLSLFLLALLLLGILQPLEGTESADGGNRLRAPSAIEHRQDQQVQGRRGHQAAQDDQGHRPLDLAAGLPAADGDR